MEQFIFAERNKREICEPSIQNPLVLPRPLSHNKGKDGGRGREREREREREKQHRGATSKRATVRWDEVHWWGGKLLTPPGQGDKLKKIPPHMRAILKTGSNQTFINPEQLLAREEGTTSENNSLLTKFRFRYLLNMGLPR